MNTTPGEETEMIVVTGATGHVGARTAELLRSQGHQVRGLSRHPSHPDDRAVNLEDAEAVAAAVDGANAVFAVVPAVAKQLTMEKNLIAAARQAGVNHYARLSSLGADPNGKDSVSRVHGQAEQDLEKSGLSYTHIRANYFMQMFLSQAENISQQNVFAICAVGSADVGFIDARDIATTATAVLTNDAHAGKTLRLTGPELLTFPAAVEVLNKAIGRTINYYDMDCTEYREIMLKVGISEFLADHVIGLYSRIGMGGSAVTTNDVALVTGEAPRTFQTFATDYAEHFR